MINHIDSVLELGEIDVPEELIKFLEINEKITQLPDSLIAKIMQDKDTNIETLPIKETVEDFFLYGLDNKTITGDPFANENKPVKTEKLNISTKEKKIA